MKNLLIAGLIGLVVALAIVLLRRQREQPTTVVQERPKEWSDHVVSLVEAGLKLIPLFDGGSRSVGAPTGDDGTLDPRAI